MMIFNSFTVANDCYILTLYCYILKYNTTTVARGTKVGYSDLTKLMKRGL